MKRSSLDLAAIATAAVPGLTAVQVGRLPEDSADFDSALVIDSKDRRWRVTSPRHPDASMKLETEQSALNALHAGARASLAFSVPSIAGTVSQGNLRTFVYNHLAGHILDLKDLESPNSKELAAEIGRAIATIHGLNHNLVEGASLPVFEAEDVRHGLLSQLDHVAASGKVPAALLRRWENMMENVAWWKFNPTVVHGDLHEERLFVDDEGLKAVTGWANLRVGDPAEDLAWVLGIGSSEAVDTIFNAYAQARGQLRDDALRQRATLSAEFALASWLAGALTHADEAQIAQAEAMLVELDQNIRAVEEHQEAERRAAAEASRLAEERAQADAQAQARSADGGETSTEAQTETHVEDKNAESESLETTSLPTLSPEDDVVRNGTETAANQDASSERARSEDAGPEQAGPEAIGSGQADSEQTRTEKPHRD